MRARRPGSGPTWTALALLLAAAGPAGLSAQQKEIILATTTSTRDAGLLDSLLPVFGRQTGYHVKVIAVGSGQALEMGRRGDADLVLSHAPEAERTLTDSGYFVGRRLIPRAANTVPANKERKTFMRNLPAVGNHEPAGPSEESGARG